MPQMGAHGQLYLVKEDGVRHQDDGRLNVEQSSHMRDCCPLQRTAPKSHVTAQMVTELSRQRSGLDNSPVGFTMGNVSLRELSSSTSFSHVCTTVTTNAS